MGAPGHLGLGLGPGGWGKLTLRCLAFLRQKAFFHFNMFLRTGNIKQNPKVFLPSPEPALRLSVLTPPSLSFNSPFSPLFGFVFPPLSTYTGGGVWLGWGALGVRLLLGWGLLLPFSPPPTRLSTRIGRSHFHPAPTSLQVAHLRPEKCLCLSRFCLLLVLFWFWFWFCFVFVFVFYSFEVFVFKKLLYFVKKVGEKNQEATVPL